MRNLHPSRQRTLLTAIGSFLAFLLLSSHVASAQATNASSPPSKSTQSTQDKPAFDDQPHFSVSGVKDTTNLGGHGSDTIVRTRDSLAKDTASLSKNDDAAQPAGSVPTLESLREKVAREPDNAGAHHALADAEEKSGDSVAAVRDYQRAAELDAREDFLFDWGSELLLHHAPEPAQEVFTKGRKSWPKSSRILIGLGAAEFTIGDSDRAVQEIAAASELNPSDPIAYLFLGKMLEASVAPSEVLTEKLQRFVSLQPDRADANYYFALALWKQRKDMPETTARRVQRLLDRAIQLDAKYAAAYLQRGIVHAEQGDDAKAISDYEQAIAIDPRAEDAHYRLAQSYRRIGDEAKAKEQIQTYETMAKESQQQAERERHEIQQFVYTLRDSGNTQKP